MFWLVWFPALNVTVRLDFHSIKNTKTIWAHFIHCSWPLTSNSRQVKSHEVGMPSCFTKSQNMDRKYWIFSKSGCFSSPWPMHPCIISGHPLKVSLSSVWSGSVLQLEYHFSCLWVSCVTPFRFSSQLAAVVINTLLRNCASRGSLSFLSLRQAAGCYSVCCFLFRFLKHPQIFLLPSIVLHLTPFNVAFFFSFLSSSFWVFLSLSSVSVFPLPSLSL